jgi:Zn-dependent peptidase ImmA (M78 family)
MQVNVSISPEILNWVLGQIQPETLNYQIVEYLESWHHGKKTPTFNQVEKVSKATGIPLGYFFLQTPPAEDMSLIEFRTVDSASLDTPSRNLMDTMHDMGQVQDWVRDYLISEGSTPLTFVGELKSQSNFMKFAQRVREILDIKIDWYTACKTAEESFNYIRTAMSNVGTIVMMSGIVGNNTHRPLDINEFRAFAVVDEYAPLIFINSNDSTNGKLFSLLHEFAHLCIGENSLFNDRDSTGTQVKKAETLCNAVAAEILVPHQAFVDAWNALEDKDNHEENIRLLSDKFKCGITVIARKAYDGNLISYDVYKKNAQLAITLYNEARKRKKERGEGGGDFYRTAASRIDKRFFHMLVGSVKSGRTLYSDAFRLTNTNRSTFSNLAETVGGGLK